MGTKKEKFPSAIVCKSCGGHIEMGNLQDVVVCSYCGTAFSSAELLNESDAVRTARIHAQAAKEIEAARMKDVAEREQREEKRGATEKFKKSKFSKVLIICAVIFAFLSIVELSDGFSVSGMIALIQTVLFLIAWLMGRGVIKEKMRNMHTLIAVVAFLLTIPFFMFLGEADSEDIVWKNIVLGEVLPQPDSDEGKILTNSEDNLSIYIQAMSDEDYMNYIDQCKDKGFTVDSKTDTISYEAYNSEGYKLNLWYNKYNEELHVSLDTPLTMAEIQWPFNHASEILPTPKSAMGCVSWENDNGFLIDIGGVSREDFTTYVLACSDRGFDINYSKGDDYYYADNADGCHLSLNYQGFNIMRIQLSMSNDEENLTDEATVTTATNNVFMIVAGEAGECGVELTLNKDTEFEETYYVYRLPSGTYKATNVGEYVAQLNIYSDELKMVDGWEEPAEVFFAELVEANESISFSIKEGQHIEIAEPDRFTIEKISDDLPVDMESADQTEASNELRPEFKEAMDSYEAFFDEYREFMEKYIAWNGTDLTLALDYAEHVSKYAEMMADFEAWENEEMNEAEAAYYLEVQARITEKLIGLVP